MVLVLWDDKLSSKMFTDFYTRQVNQPGMHIINLSVMNSLDYNKKAIQQSIGENNNPVIVCLQLMKNTDYIYLVNESGLVDGINFNLIVKLDRSAKLEVILGDEESRLKGSWEHFIGGLK